MKAEIFIDGSQGEGGGQILRTSIALSMITGKPIRIENIRAGRKKPGLLRQHLTAISAAVAVGKAEVRGNSIGSRDLAFAPQGIHPGEYRFSVGTAGSCTLVLQTVLPALMTAQGPSELVLEGGTHNPYAPPFDFLDKAFLPLINRMGPFVQAKLERPGFFPAGGGQIRVSITPSKTLSRIELLARGEIRKKRAVARVAQIPFHVAERELKVVVDYLGWTHDHLKAEEIDRSKGPGNVLCIELQSEAVTEVFTGFGEKGVTAERVAKTTCREVRQYLKYDAPVGRYLADQLLIPMALAGGGRIRTYSPTMHTRTNAEIITRFLDVEFAMDKGEDGTVVIEVKRIEKKE